MWYLLVVVLRRITALVQTGDDGRAGPSEDVAERHRRRPAGRHRRLVVERRPGRAGPLG